ncbi:MAG: preprotein translocase subunit SecE [Chloroflexi bacterium]|nr:MAG: preprotein translocase subunit SecE [Chloroflexota bacterium]
MGQYKTHTARAERIVFGNLRAYFQESWAELRKVSWPDRQTVVNLTLIVIGVSVAVGAYIAILDQVMHFALSQVFQ